ncbi:MAG: marine proteobacterial sortase target protein [Gammaproteobacteria bacterium]|nr:marine proteobacterial sortase target protein [Gammaproteobacteria bacterium]
MNRNQSTQEQVSSMLVIYSWGDVVKFISFVALGWLAVVFFISSANAAVERSDDLNEIEMHQVKSGSLLFKSEKGSRYQLAATLETDVQIEVTGMIARSALKQTFKNDSGRWLEGVYVFPLPENAAVDRLRMQIGERLIEGVIKPREEAKRLYKKARNEGRKASLIEQERPDLFTSSVANIAPGETVVIEIEYQQAVRYDNGEFRLRFPMAITPRYIPGSPVVNEEEVTAFDGSGWAMNTHQVIDAARITPPVWGSDEKINPVRLSVMINAGFKLANVESAYHRITVKQSIGNKMAVSLTDEVVYAERDFELMWRPEAVNMPRAALFTEEKEGELYHLVMVLPPANEDLNKMKAERIGREVIYVIDTSGSMSGTSINQARRALSLALKRLHPGDRFNVISFNSTTDKLFSSAREVTHHNLRDAQRYVSSLEANGGTEIRGALEASLASQRESALVRQVVFLTDGSVGNEAELFKLIKQKLGNSRLFTIGIGSAPNSHFMSKAAQFGRGTFTYIGDIDEVETKMNDLFHKLETAVMTDLTIKFDDPAVEVWPKRLPDLYQGEPLLLTARTKLNNQTVVVSGKRQNKGWENSFQLKQSGSDRGIATMWARAKIAALMDRIHEGEEEKKIKPAVVNIALQHNLVSKYTSLVAVDMTPVRPVDEVLDTLALPVNLPKGQAHAKIFGRHAQTATPAQLQLMIGVMLLLAALFLWRRNKTVRVNRDA